MDNALTGLAGLWGVLGAAAFFVLLVVAKLIFKVNLPDRILVITGRKTKKAGRTFGFSVERGRTTCIPYLQTVCDLDIGVIPINVRVEGVNSANGITVGADATACVCIDDDDEAMLYTSVERLMGKNRDQIKGQIQQTLVGNFRGALNKATPLEAIGMTESVLDETTVPAKHAERAQFRAELVRDINSDLSSFGMKVVSVSLQKIWDTSNYIANLAQKTLAEKRQQVEIEEAALGAIAEKAESDSERRIQVAKAKADQLIIAAREKLEMFRRESQGDIQKIKLSAEQSIQQAKNSGERDVQEQLVHLQSLKNQTQVTLHAEASKAAQEILAEGEQTAVNLIEQTRNDILAQKIDLLKNALNRGKTVLFIQQQLPKLYEIYKKNASAAKVDSLLIMDDKQGFSGAVNRGPAAFADFLTTMEKALGLSVKNYVNPAEEKA